MTVQTKALLVLGALLGVFWIMLVAWHPGVPAPVLLPRELL